MLLNIVLIILLIGIVLFAIGMLCSKNFVVSTYEIKTNKLIKDIKIVVLADIHNKVFEDNNFKIIEKIKYYSPDMILIPGDIIVAKYTKEVSDLLICEKWLEGLSSIAPIYFENGNHESKIRNFEVYNEILNLFKKYNVCELNNKMVSIDGSNINIYGLELPGKYYEKFKTIKLDVEEINKLIGACELDKFNILLAHNPEYFDTYNDYGADLTIGGHLHGGIMQLPFIGGVISTSFKLFPKYAGGIYKGDGTTMIVSRGIGWHTIPVRLFNPPDLVFIELKAEKEGAS